MRVRVRNSVVVCSASAAFGFLVWALSPLLVGQAEPWDSTWPFYSASSLAAGALIGALFPRRFLLAYLGCWFGQVLALLTLPELDRAWWLLGTFTTAIGSLLFITSYALVSTSRQRAA